MKKPAKNRVRSSASRGKSRETEARLQAIIDNVLDGIITIDEHGIVETFNPAAEKIFGYQAEEVIGNSVNALMPQPYAAEHDGYLRSYLQTGNAKIIGIGREVAGRRKDGTLFPVDLAVTEMAVGGRRKFVGILRDITERKQVENLITQQSQALMDMSTPALKIWDGVLLLPLIGAIDTNRAQQIIESLLDAVVANDARVAVIDVTGVPIIDTTVAQHLLKTISAAAMLGARVIVTGISPEIAHTLVRLRVDFASIHTCGTLRTGVAEAVAFIGKQVVAEAEPR